MTKRRRSLIGLASDISTLIKEYNELEAELDVKDKVIEAMAGELVPWVNLYDYVYHKRDMKKALIEIKEHFHKQVEEVK